MSKLQELINRCKDSVYLSVNEHRGVYQSIPDYIKEERESLELDITPEEEAFMLKENCAYKLQFYPETSIGFYVVYGTSVDEVAEKALNILDNEK